MLKTAGLEETGVTDPRTQKDIFISTTARIIYRKAWAGEYSSMRNARLNAIIAKDFAGNSGNVIHYFWMDKKDRIIAEIRAAASGMFYISAIRGNRVDILTLQSSWLQPKYNPSGEVIELGEE